MTQEINNTPRLVELKIDDRTYRCLCDIKRTSMEITRGVEQYWNVGETINVPTSELSIKLNLEGRILTNKPALTLELPYPPSINHSHYGNHRLTKPVREFRAQVRTLVFLHQHNTQRAQPLPFKTRLVVWVDLFAPDRRRRDSDNPIKPLWDALTGAGVWDDDSQIKEHHVKRFDKDEHNYKKGLCIIRIEELNGDEKCN